MKKNQNNKVGNKIAVDLGFGKKFKANIDGVDLSQSINYAKVFGVSPKTLNIMIGRKVKTLNDLINKMEDDDFTDMKRNDLRVRHDIGKLRMFRKKLMKKDLAIEEQERISGEELVINNLVEQMEGIEWKVGEE